MRCFPSAVRPSLKVALKPTPVCRWATHGTPTVTRHLPLELHELKQDHIRGLIHSEFECDCVGTCRRFGPSMPHCSDLCHPQTFIYLVLLRFVNIFLSKQCTGTGSLTKKHKGTYRRIEAMQNCPGLRLLSSPSQLGAAPLRRSDHISPTGELFIYLFNFIISAEWRYD